MIDSGGPAADRRVWRPAHSRSGRHGSAPKCSVPAFCASGPDTGTAASRKRLFSSTSDSGRAPGKTLQRPESTTAYNGRVTTWACHQASAKRRRRTKNCAGNFLHVNGIAEERGAAEEMCSTYLCVRHPGRISTWSGSTRTRAAKRGPDFASSPEQQEQQGALGMERTLPGGAPRIEPNSWQSVMCESHVTECSCRVETGECPFIPPRTPCDLWLYDT